MVTFRSLIHGQEQNELCTEKDMILMPLLVCSVHKTLVTPSSCHSEKMLWNSSLPLFALCLSGCPPHPNCYHLCWQYHSPCGDILHAIMNPLVGDLWVNLRKHYSPELPILQLLLQAHLLTSTFINIFFLLLPTHLQIRPKQITCSPVLLVPFTSFSVSFLHPFFPLRRYVTSRTCALIGASHLL